MNNTPTPPPIPTVPQEQKAQATPFPQPAQCPLCKTSYAWDGHKCNHCASDDGTQRLMPLYNDLEHFPFTRKLKEYYYSLGTASFVLAGLLGVFCGAAFLDSGDPVWLWGLLVLLVLLIVGLSFYLGAEMIGMAIVVVDSIQKIERHLRYRK